MKIPLNTPLNTPLRTSSNRRALLASVFFAIFAAACGGGSNPSPPPPVGGFSNASLNGQFAFSMSGTESCFIGGVFVPSFFARIGTFSADGGGRVTGGVEDVNVCTGTDTLVFTGGSYSILADGRGTLSLTNFTGTTNYSITLSTTSQGLIVQTDTDVTAGGSFQKQTTSDFSVTKIVDGYVFDFSGVGLDSSSNPIAQSIIGRFDADGNQGIQNGLFDANDAGTPSGQLTFPNGAFYQLDNSLPQSGRGTANIAGQNLAFYIVNSSRIKFLSSDLDFPIVLVGEATTQQIVVFDDTSLKGNFAFLIGGSSASGPIATAGRFTADGGGNLTSIVLDENNSGSLTPVNAGTGTYTVDTNGFGGGAASFSATAGTFEFIFYLASPTQAVFQEIDMNITSDGSFSVQTSSPIIASSVAGEYAFIWSGVTSGEDDFVGQQTVTSASTSNVTGAVDFNVSDISGFRKQFFNYPFNGSLALGSAPDGRNALTVTTTPSPQTTYKFSAYVVDQNTIFLVGVDNNRVIAGSNTRQP